MREGRFNSVRSSPLVDSCDPQLDEPRLPIRDGRQPPAGAAITEEVVRGRDKMGVYIGR